MKKDSKKIGVNSEFTVIDFDNALITNCKIIYDFDADTPNRKGLLRFKESSNIG